MPRKRTEQVLVDPVAAAERLLEQQAAPEPLASMTGPDAETERGRSLPWADPGHDVAGDIREARATAQCALGHPNTGDARFCGQCGLAMDAPAPAKLDMEAARPKPASALTAAERAERDRQHAEALRLAAEMERMQPDFVPPEGETVLIHFIEDGFTFAGQVWYRGQEIELGPAHPRWEQARSWILLDRCAQVERYGKQFFERGPWPGRRSYTEGAGAFEQLATEDGKGRFAGPGLDALRRADEAERRRGRAVPAPLR
jgi:hypothetical protein